MEKKILGVMIFLALIATACINDYEGNAIDGDAIRFDTSITGLTRGTYIYANFNEFLVTALDGTTVRFSDERVSKVSGSGLDWRMDNTQYWQEPSLSFFGYAPLSVKSKVTVNGTKHTLSGFTPAAKTTDQIDLITAYADGTRGSNVVMDFKHALSQIEILACNKSDRYTVEVIGLKLAHVPSTADLTFQATADGYPSWTAPTSVADYFVKGATPLTLSDEAKSIMFTSTSNPNNLLMIPQTLAAWTSGATVDGAYIAVLCRISDGSTQVFPQTSGKYAFAAVPVATPTQWNPGYKYTYTLNFFSTTGGAGLIDPEADSPTDDDIDPSPDDGKQGGDPIMDSPITFTVSITDWLPGDDVEINMQ